MLANASYWDNSEPYGALPWRSDLSGKCKALCLLRRRWMRGLGQGWFQDSEECQLCRRAAGRGGRIDLRAPEQVLPSWPWPCSACPAAWRGGRQPPPLPCTPDPAIVDHTVYITLLTTLRLLFSVFPNPFQHFHIKRQKVWTAGFSLSSKSWPVPSFNRNAIKWSESLKMSQVGLFCLCPAIRGIFQQMNMCRNSFQVLGRC